MCSISTTKIKTKAMLQLTLISGRGHRSNHRRLTAAGPSFKVGKVPERKKLQKVSDVQVSEILGFEEVSDQL